MHREGKYFDFNVVRGLQDINLEEWQAFDLIDAATKAYLKDGRPKPKLTLKKLKMPMMGISLRKSATILGPIKLQLKQR